jgi:rfaE bifunctional protein nucleotidyltransferase chain/domain
MLSLKKIISKDRLSKIILNFKRKKKKVIFTNGCFDILHAGHIDLLRFAKTQSDILIVGLNSDLSIKKIKGQKRPINSFHNRAKILSELISVDYIVKQNETNPIKLLLSIMPFMHCKGSDYNEEDLIENKTLKKINCKLVLFEIKKKISSSKILSKLY